MHKILSIRLLFGFLLEGREKKEGEHNDETDFNGLWIKWKKKKQNIIKRVNQNKMKIEMTWVQYSILVRMCIRNI